MKYYILTLAATAALFLTGCETPEGEPYRAGTGALIGGGIGAATGAMVAGRHGAEGAIIGGALGAITGGLIGQSMDAEHRERLRAEAPQTYVRVDQGQPLAIADVQALAKAGVSDQVIINQINSTRTVYHLSAEDIITLTNAGVSQKVIEYMINTPNTVGAQPVTVVPSAPPPPVSETVIVAPGPGYVWTPGYWQWHGHWLWIGGRWAYPPYPHSVWVNGYWAHHGHGWRWSGGHWR